ncbi:MAG: HU family DNA-binding protein [Pseudomonadota bacterium]
MARSTTKKATTGTRSRVSATAKAAAAASKAAETAKADGPVTHAPPETIKTLGKRELIDRVVEASGIKKKAAKPVIEAMLKELGDALTRGETLNLQPFGKGIVKSRKSFENAEVVEVRLRRSKQAIAAAGDSASVPEPSESAVAKDPLAEAAE